HKETRFAGGGAFAVPGVERNQHCLAATESVGSILAARLRYAKHRENLVADVFLDRAAADEDLCRHALVKLPQQRDHRFRGHAFSLAGKADDASEQHRHILTSNRTQWFVALSQHRREMW